MLKDYTSIELQLANFYTSAQKLMFYCEVVSVEASGFIREKASILNGHSERLNFSKDILKFVKIPNISICWERWHSDKVGRHEHEFIDFFYIK